VLLVSERRCLELPATYPALDLCFGLCLGKAVADFHERDELLRVLDLRQVQGGETAPPLPGVSPVSGLAGATVISLSPPENPNMFISFGGVAVVRLLLVAQSS
jgi:hypothetical protein